MAFTVQPSQFVSFGIAVLIVWRVYARIRRMVGRQRLSNVRPWITVCLFPVLIALLLFGSFDRPWNALALMAGLALGAGLGTYGLRFTKFEETPAGLFYTPHSHFGIALSLLFLGRIAYRAIQFYLAAAPITGPPTYVAHSPLTLLLFGTLAGYYVMYAVGLLRWRRRVEASLGIKYTT